MRARLEGAPGCKPYAGVAGVLVCALLTLTASCQLSGPPAGVPVPRAPIAADAARTGPGGEAAPESRVFRVRVVDGRNGNALPNAHVRLWYDDASGPGYLLATDKLGVAIMPEPVGTPVRVLLSPLDRVDCRKLALNGPAPGYNLQQIAATGTASENGCGVVAAKPLAGELLLFVRPLRWYEGINRDTR